MAKSSAGVSAQPGAWATSGDQARPGLPFSGDFSSENTEVLHGRETKVCTAVICTHIYVSFRVKQTEVLSQLCTRLGPLFSPLLSHSAILLCRNFMILGLSHFYSLVMLKPKNFYINHS